MNVKEAYSILELPETSTPEEAKKRYREFTKKYHPDVNKDSGAEDKFKKINEAYQIVSTGKSTDREDMRPQSSYNPFTRQRVVRVENINLHTTVSFKDAVLGCKKELKFNRKSKCVNCDGEGETTINNGCTKCGGRGQVVGKQGNMVFIRTCDLCQGKSQTISCKNCNATGAVDVEASINVTIPGGVVNGNVLRLSGMGNFIGHFGPMEQHTDAHLYVTVIPESGLILNGIHVISNLEISLLDALKGCYKAVNTILGTQEIKINPLSKNKDEVIIPKLGVNRMGDQKVILDIKYPEDTDALIKVLSYKEN